MLVLDTSGSMQGQPIDHLNQGLSAFEKQLKHNALAVRRVEVGVITFGAGGVQQVQPFIQARHFVAPTLAADGVTPMGEAVTMALQALRTRKNEYRTMGLPLPAVAHPAHRRRAKRRRLGGRRRRDATGGTAEGAELFSHCGGRRGKSRHPAAVFEQTAAALGGLRLRRVIRVVVGKSR